MSVLVWFIACIHLSYPINHIINVSVKHLLHPHLGKEPSQKGGLLLLLLRREHVLGGGGGLGGGLRV